MTSKEKAEYLVNKLKKYSYYPKTNDDILFVNELNKNAKQCALITVSEILDALIEINECGYDSLDKYWNQVKQELEKL
jgi:hypothetical protein